jgi:hypothetical protein
VIYGEKFVWGHIPKTAGSSTADMFLLFPSLIKYYNGHTPIPKKHKHIGIQHAGFNYMAENLGKDFSNKKKILNIRPLPYWILSWCFHFDTYGLNNIKQPFDEEQYEFLRQGKIKQIHSDGKLFKIHTGDEWLASFSSHEVDYWIRTDYLAEDFIKVASNFTEIDEDRKKKIKSIKANVNVKNKKYKKNLNEWFTQEDINTIYKNNPAWSKIEEKVYGKLVILND